MKEQRRLAAIVSADVAGYSRLMGRDESGTLAVLKALRREVVDPRITAHGGRIVKTTGDGLLLEFPSVVDAVRCVIEVQTVMAERGDGVPEDRRIAFRIGLHIGDIIIDSDDIFGDGVNVAARLEALAEPGGLCLSGDAWRQVRGKVEASFEAIGTQSLKNIAHPVETWRWSPVAAASPLTGESGRDPQGTGLALPDKPSIAVLPFQNMSGDPEQEYFVDGIAEDIITELSRFREMFVIARNSSFIYKGRAVDLKQVGRELGVRHVLEGSSRKAGDRVRVTAQLIDCKSGRHLWAERYDRSLADIFAVQEEITRAIVAQIAPAIEASTYARTRRAHPESLSAHELAMRAWFEADAAYAAADATLRDRTMALAQQALKLDPDCVLAWVVMGWVRWQSVFYSDREQSEEMCRPGLDAARRAIELDQYEHRAFVLRGLLHLELRRHNDALADLRHACELNPNDARALQGLAFTELMSGEAVAAKAHGLQSLRLNPRDPTRYNTTSFLANACFFTGEYAEGLKWIEESKRERPGFRPTIMTAIKLHVGLGQLDRAKAEAALLNSTEIAARVRSGASVVRRPEDRERDLRFLRIGFGLEELGPPLPPSHATLPLPDKPSIAVLPFQNMSGDPEQEYFADGIVEDIITALSRFKSLFVIARNSTFTYKGRAVDIKQVGHDLGVRYVLEGSVRKAGTRLRLTGQLIDGATGSHLWADRFDGAIEDVFELQDRITTSVVGAIVPKLDQAEIDRAAAKRTGNLSSYDHLLRGMAGLHRLDKDGAALALNHLREAIRLDPTFSAAHAWASIAYSRRRQSRWMLDVERESEEGVRLGRRAIELAKDDAFALGAGGFAIAFMGDDLDAGLAFIDRGLALNPNLALAWQASGWVRSYIGDPDTAIEHLAHAIRLSPIDPQIAQLNLALGVALRCAGRFAESAQWAQKALREMPNLLPAWITLAAAYGLSGQLDDARQAAQRALLIDPGLRMPNFNHNVFFRRQQDREAMRTGLRLAGIPE